MSGFMRSDLPVAADPANRFLPWLVATMVFLATLALAGALGLQEMADRWRGQMSGTLTVQIPAAAEATETAARVERAVRLLASLPEVAGASAVADEQLVKMLEPWLGSADLIGDLPVPRLIDVTLRPEGGGGVDLAAMTARLRDVAPGAMIDDHRVWLGRLIALADGIRLLAWATLGLVGMATTVAVIHATRSGLAVHRPHIEVLHLVGATDRYIARQFARRALMHGVVGGVLGIGLATPALAGVLVLLAPLEGGLIPTVEPRPEHLAALAALPLLAGGVAMLTAHRTVRRHLARML